MGLDRTIGGSRALGLLAVEQVQHHGCTETGGADAETGEARCVGHPSPVRRTEERAEPAAQVDRPAPGMGEPDALELREGRRRSGPTRARTCLDAGRATARSCAEVVDGVVASEQDAVVGGQPVVVELVGAVADPLAVRPADRRELLRRERLGRERVVVDRHDERPHPSHERREGVGTQGHLGGCERCQSAVTTSTRAGPLASIGHQGALVERDAQGLGRFGQAPGELRGMHQDCVVAVPEAGPVRGRRDLCPYLVAVEEAAVSALGRCPQPSTWYASVAT